MEKNRKKLIATALKRKGLKRGHHKAKKKPKKEVGWKKVPDLPW